MARHTPGPWHVRVDPQDGRAGLVANHEAGIAAPFYAGRSTEEINANARLIAAAPDLLKALRPFANFACDPPNDCHNCRAARAIAEVERREAADAITGSAATDASGQRGARPVGGGA